MNKTTMECYTEGWKKIGDYRGRSTRRAFWLFIFINIIILLFIAVLTYLGLTLSVTDETGRGGMLLVWGWYVLLPLGGLAPLVLLPPIVAAGIRRMHDIGKSGWWFGGLLFAKLAGLPLLITLASRLLPVNAVNLWVIPMASLAGTVMSCVLLWLCCKPTVPGNEPRPDTRRPGALL